MRIFPLLCATALLTLPAKADKFWMGDPGQKATADSRADVIEGFLLDQDATSYVVRIVGGELVLRKSSVWKHEKDGLTIEKILDLEKKEHQRLAAAEERRGLARAAARLMRNAHTVDASASRRLMDEPAAEVVEVEDTSTADFDPVIGRASDAAVLSRSELQRELQVAWTLTKDRRYLKALRKTRRMK